MSAKLILGLSVIILFSCSITGYLSYRTHLQLFEEEYSDQYAKANEQAMANLELRIQEIYRISNYIVFNSVIEKVVTKLMTNKGDNLFEDYLEHDELQSLLRQVKLDAPVIKTVLFYDLQGTNYYYGHIDESIGRLNDEAFRDVMRNVGPSNGQLIWMRKVLPSPSDEGKSNNVIIASRWMKKGKTLETYGLLVMILDEALFSGPLRDLAKGRDGRVYLYEQRGLPLYQQGDSGPAPVPEADSPPVYIRRENGGTNLYALHRSPMFQFTLLSRVSLEAFQEKSKILLNISLYSGLGAIALSCVLIALLSRRLLRPMKDLVKAMRMMRGGNFDVRVRPRSKDELGFLGESFNAMADNVRSLIEEVYLRQLSEREAEMKALQAQLNPHFLYNTLNGFYWKLYLQNDMESANLVSALSSLLKYSLERVSKRTTLREELQQIRNYLDIQAAFVENRFQAEIRAADEALDCTVLRLILQPVVENAFVHAFRDRAADKKLVIEASREGDMLVVAIADNGCGMTAEQIGRIREAERAGEKPSIGLRSVVRRIDLTYGEPYGLDIESVPGEGTTVVLRLPFETFAAPESA
ncbi:sensor histidine kinase [Paenibacillus flagellatus]|uniref:Sensor histidine kinase n=2 Tax=Paenibacillus flagellatus TaxID=2211139 RepID=A0A2V5K3G6_9BACL|nr:sensor histidine kinase [Paenibacillus flagellatus]